MNVASAIVDGAELRLRRPAPSLRPYLGCFWSMTTTPYTRLRTLPDASATLSVESRQNALPACFFIGPRLAPAMRVPGTERQLLGVRLRPGVAYALAGIPVYKLVERRRRLSALLPKDAPLLERRLTRVRTVDERWDVLEEFLERRLAGARVDSRVQRALERIEARGGQIHIRQLACECQVSPRHLHTLFCRWIGFSPKRLARISRFQTVLQHLEASPSESMAGLATGLGYFDQAHLVNEVAQFAGETPGRIVPYRIADFSKTRCE